MPIGWLWLYGVCSRFRSGGFRSCREKGTRSSCWGRMETMPASEILPATVAVIILTYNEEANIVQALDSVGDWANEIFILDSLSTDRTLDIARQFGCHI